MGEQLDIKIKSRKVLRSTFTRTSTALERLLAAEIRDISEIDTTWELLRYKFDELSALDSQIFELMVVNASEIELEREIESRDGYFKTFSTFRSNIDKLHGNTAAEVNTVDSTGTHNSHNSGVNENSTGRRKFKLPRIEFKHYDGSIRGWLAFWAQFRKVHEDESIDNNDKIEYLLQATVQGSRARQLVESYPAMGENYSKIVESMESRFGRKDLQIEFYVRELLRLILSNSARKQKIEIASLYDSIETQLRALETLGITSENCSAILFPLIESCLPYDLLTVWQRSSTCHSPEKDASCTVSPLEIRLKKLLLFLQHEVENEQRVSLATEGFGLQRHSSHDGTDHTGPSRNKSTQKRFPDCPTAMGLVNCEVVSKITTCVFCSGSHNSDSCFKAQKMNLTQKRSILSSKKVCFRCLKGGHSTNNCRTRLSCAVCSKSHVVIMCPDIPSNKQTERVPDSLHNSPNNIPPDIPKDQTLANRTSTHTFLQTLQVTLIGVNGSKTVRALIDSGSQRSYILKGTATVLGLQSKAQEKLIHCLFGGSEISTSHHCYDVTIKHGRFNFKFEVLDQPSICSEVASIFQGQWTSELKDLGIELSDVNGSGPIELLLGVDVVGILYTGNRRQLSCGLVAMETQVGWTLMGKVPVSSPRSAVTMTTVNLLIKNASISDLWELEVIGIKNPTDRLSKEDMALAAKELFLQTVTADNHGRYEVRLPWLEGHPPLSNNYTLAQKRLSSVVRKLKNDGLFSQYQDIFNEWLAEGIIEVVPRSVLDLESGHFLPHRPVIKESSVTTKIRPVFDASAHEKDRPSLNHCLEKGPNLIELIPSLLLRFRENKIGVVADIKKAFLQIGVNEKDRNYLKFLWMDTQGQEVVFRHKRVVFGLISSPFLLGACLEYHLTCALNSLLEKAAPYSSETINRLRRSFYVDNCVTSLGNDDAVSQFIKEARAIMSEGQFDLRGWERTQSSVSETGPNPCPVLGLTWNPQTDVLRISQHFLHDDDDNQNMVVTKRLILSITQRVFDPIGYLCPALLVPKLILQKLWSEELTWDQPVDDSIANAFINWYKELNYLMKIEVPRWVMAGEDEAEHLSLHTFCDASQEAYACVVFLRVRRRDEVKISLVAAKSRVAPIRKADSKMTIPRLELLAATIGARLYHQTKENLRGPIDSFFWSDSSTVVSWIQRKEEWGIFVWNRVSEIRDLTPAENWRHLPGVHNPADLPSRGCSPKQLSRSRWWEGPTWLYSEPKDWPLPQPEYNEHEISVERKKRLVTVLSNTQKHGIDTSSDDRWNLSYFSKYNKTVRMLAWMFRFLYNIRHPSGKRTGDLSAQEHDIAEKFLLKIVQEEGFSDKEVRTLHTLNLFQGIDKLFRIKSRISAREDTEDFRFPIVLPSKHHVVRCLIMDLHVQSCHVGTQGLLSLLREKYWVICGRKTVKSVIAKCGRCKRYTAKPLTVEPPPLPIERVRDAIAFEVTGVDFAGPLYLKNGGKAWICLFTCAIFRAVHLELTTSLSTASFLKVLRRFVSRRGRPKTIFSDNGTNFVGAENALSLLDWDAIVRETAVQRITWRFNPPTAAWWGGFWERLIGILKQLLRRVLGRASLNYEDLLTLICECEAVVNNRPLTYLSEDSEDLVALTPSMFLTDQTEFGMPDCDAVDNVSMCRKARKIQTLRESLRVRFRSEYLGQLELRKNRKRCRQIAVGDIVLIGSDNSKRLDWPLGRVIETLPGRDGQTRLAKIATAKGQMLRPLQRLFPLECCTVPEFESNEETSLQKSERVPDVMKETPINTTSRSETVFQEDAECLSAGVSKVNFTRSGRAIKVPKRFL